MAFTITKGRVNLPKKTNQKPEAKKKPGKSATRECLTSPHLAAELSRQGLSGRRLKFASLGPMRKSATGRQRK